MNKIILRTNKELGEAIRSIRKARNLEQTELARMASVRQALISDIENGVTSARSDTIFKILAALDMDLTFVPRIQSKFNPEDY